MLLFGTLINPFAPLLNLLAMFMDGDEDDETEDDDSDSTSDEGDENQSGDEEEDEEDADDSEEDDDEESDDEEDDEDEDDSSDDLRESERTRRNAARLDSDKDEMLTASMEANVQSLIENPEKAEEKLQALQARNPKLAARLLRLYENRKNNALGALLKDADPAVKQAFTSLLSQVEAIKDRTDRQFGDQEKRMYKDWAKDGHPYLVAKTPEGKTPKAQKLRTVLANVIDERFQDDVLTEDMLEDALAIAKRRVNWKDSSMMKQMKKQAAEQAARGRSIVSAGAGKGIKSGKSATANAEMAERFGDSSPERLKKVAKAKKEAGFIK